MALKTILVNLSQIKEDKSLRLDCKFFWLEKTFRELKESNPTLKIVELRDLKEDIVSGSYVDTYVEESKGIPYIRVSDIRPFILDENKGNYKFVNEGISEKIKTKKNQLIVPRTSAKAEFLGKASIIDESNEAWGTSQHVTRISVNDKLISPYYLLAFFNSAIFKYQMTISSQGNTRVELTHSQMDKIKVIIPNRDVMESISSRVKSCIKRNRVSISLIKDSKSFFLSKIKNTRINKKNDFSVNLLDMNKEFLWTPRYSDPTTVLMEKNLKSYEGVEIKDIANIKKGIEPGSDSYNFYLSKEKGDIPFIRTADICNNYIELLPDYFIDKKMLPEDLTLKKNDILFTKDGKIGLTSMATIEDKAIISSGILRIRINKQHWGKKNIHPEYIFLALSVFECGGCQAKRRTVIGTTIPHLKDKYINKFFIPLIDNKDMDKISKDIGEAFSLIGTNKKHFGDVLKEIDSFMDL